MSGLEVVAVVASISQIVTYSAKIASMLEDVYAHAQQAKAQYEKRQNQISQLQSLLDFIRGTEYLHTEPIKLHLVEIEKNTKYLEQELGRIHKNISPKLWKRFCKELWGRTTPVNSLNMTFATIEEDKNSLALCILATCGQSLGSMEHRAGNTAEKVDRIHNALLKQPAILSGIQEIKEMVTQSPGAMQYGKDYTKRSRQQRPSLAKGATNISFPETSSKCALEAASECIRDVAQPKLKLVPPGDLESGFVQPHESPSETPRTTTTLSIDTLVNSSPSDPPSEAARDRTGRAYINMQSRENARQLNGNIDSGQCPREWFSCYKDSIAEGNSLQINGDVGDPNMALSLFAK